jgi:hypothetical protein
MESNKSENLLHDSMKILPVCGKFSILCATTKKKKEIRSERKVEQVRVFISQKNMGKSF